MKKCAYEGCNISFEPRYRTTEKYCSFQCMVRDSKNKPKKVQKPIRHRSEKRSKQERVYTAKRIEFLSRKENKFCAVFPKQLATEVHHKKGRIGSLLTDEKFFLAVSREGHKFVEENPEIAKKKGWSLSRLSRK